VYEQQRIIRSNIRGDQKEIEIPEGSDISKHIITVNEVNCREVGETIDYKTKKTVLGSNGGTTVSFGFKQILRDHDGIPVSHDVPISPEEIQSHPVYDDLNGSVYPKDSNKILLHIDSTKPLRVENGVITFFHIAEAIIRSKHDIQRVKYKEKSEESTE
jgi:hypothetical protein